MADNSNNENLGLGVLFEGDPTKIIQAFEKVEKALQKLVSDMEQSGTVSEKFANKLNKSFEGVTSAVSGVAKEVSSYVNEVNKLADQSAKVTQSNSNIAKSINNSQEALKAHVGSIADAREALKGLNAVQISQVYNSGMSAKMFDTLSSKLKTFSGASYESRTALAQMALASGDNVILFKQNASELEKLEKAINKYKDSMIGSGQASKKEMNEWASSIDRVKASSDFLQMGITKVGDVALSSSQSFSKYSKEVESIAIKYKDLISSGTSYAEQAKKIIDQTQLGNVAMNDANAMLNRISKSWNESEKEIAKWDATSQKVISKFPDLSNAVANLNNHIKSGGVTTKEATNILNGYAEKAKAAGSQMSVFQQFVSGLHSKLSGMASAANVATGYFADLGHAIGSMAAWIPAAMIISTLTESVTGSIASVKNFDQSLKNLQAVSGGTEAEIKLLGQEMLRISDTTKYSADEIAQGAVFIAQAGFSAAESLQVISAAAIGAQGTMEPLTTSADLLTTVIRAFQEPASNAGIIMDALAVAANESKTNLEGLRTVFNYIGPVAKAAGADLNETLGAVMALSNAGIRMSTVGTSLRQVFINLEAPNSKFKEAIQASGMTVDDFNIKAKGLVPVLTNLDKIIGGDLSNATQFFNIRASNTALVLSKMHDYVGLLAKDTMEYGAAQAMASTQTEGLFVKIEILSNKFQN
ncbi:MAG: phage tail tape measure protein, partial [Porphyromonadaceae bacterium]|nr:phage tail tape measure protein [Porphyromonadaceae bacterium]